MMHHYLYIDMQLILYIDCESYKCVEFIGSAKVWWRHTSFLYINYIMPSANDCNFTSSYPVWVFSSFSCRFAQCSTSASEWSGVARASTLVLYPTSQREFSTFSFQYDVSRRFTLYVWFCWDTFNISCSESFFFFCHRIMVIHMLFSVSIEVIMWVFILSHVSMVCYAHWLI